MKFLKSCEKENVIGLVRKYSHCHKKKNEILNSYIRRTGK